MNTDDKHDRSGRVALESELWLQTPTYRGPFDKAYHEITKQFIGRPKLSPPNYRPSDEGNTRKPR